MKISNDDIYFVSGEPYFKISGLMRILDDLQMIDDLFTEIHCDRMVAIVGRTGGAVTIASVKRSHSKVDPRFDEWRAVGLALTTAFPDVVEAIKCKCEDIGPA